MSDFSRFRSALGGFSRTDVVSYIEELSASHRKALEKAQAEQQALSEQLDALRLENTRLKEQAADAQARCEKMQEEDAALQEQVQSLSQEAAELAEKLAQAEDAAKTHAQAQQDAEPEENLTEMELAAYRRAEQTERNAIARAKKLHEQMQMLCERSKDRYQDAGEELAALSEDLSTGLSRLAQTLADLEVVFDDTQSAFEELTPADAE